MTLSELIVDRALKGAALGPIEGEKMCNDCAFKKGTAPNNDEIFIDYLTGEFCRGTVLDCHIEEKVCAGFLYWKQYFESLEKSKA